MKKKAATAAVVVILIGTSATFAYLYFRADDLRQTLADKVVKVENDLSVTISDLGGYTRYTDYVAETKKAMVGQSKFLAARVDRSYVLIEHILRSVWGISSDATVSVTYAVEYSVGFDLAPDSFAISGDRSRIVITLRGKPGLVASPSVNILSHEIIGKGIFIDEKAAIIAIQQRLLSIAKRQSVDIVKEPAVIALSEKKLGEFLLDFMRKQPGVKFVPAIEFAYK